MRWQTTKPMLEIQTSDPATPRRIVAGGAGALLGFAPVAINVGGPLVAGEGHDAADAVFGLFGVLAVVRQPGGN